MPNYTVTLTLTVNITARNEEQAQERAGKVANRVADAIVLDLNLTAGESYRLVRQLRESGDRS